MALRQLRQDSLIVTVRGRNMQVQWLPLHAHAPVGGVTLVRVVVIQAMQAQRPIVAANRDNHQDCKPRRSVCSVV